jgi:signal transduction histidine kinase
MTWLNSIRGRLALVSALVIAVVLTLAGLGLTLLFQSYIEKRIDQEMRGRILDLAGAVTLDDAGQPALLRPPSDPRYRNPYSGVYWYVREGDATILRSRSLWDVTIAAPAAPSGTESVQDTVGPGGSDVYVLERPVELGEPPSERRIVLGVAIDKAEVQALSSSFGSEMAMGLALIGLLLFAGAWLQASYGLKPLANIRSQLALLHRGERNGLDGPFPAEVDQLASDLNALFARQKDMIARARERAGTLAHGLKTPMTVLYGEARRLELEGNAQSAQFIREQLDLIRNQLGRELARARAHGESASLGIHADASLTIERLVDLMKRMPRGGDLVWELPLPGIQVAMDADDLGEILGNLLDNARKWANRRVSISIDERPGGRMEIAIADDGPGIPEAARGTALARGERVTTTQEGSGLGLAIAQDLVNQYGAVLRLGASEWGGTRVSFDVPGVALQSPPAADAPSKPQPKDQPQAQMQLGLTLRDPA